MRLTEAHDTASAAAATRETATVDRTSTVLGLRLFSRGPVSSARVGAPAIASSANAGPVSAGYSQNESTEPCNSQYAEPARQARAIPGETDRRAARAARE